VTQEEAAAFEELADYRSSTTEYRDPYTRGYYAECEYQYFHKARKLRSKSAEGDRHDR